MADPEAPPYTIDIPGISDIFKFGAAPVYDKKLKQQRFMRMKTAKSPLAENLKWIPQLITKLDNAQDLLYTAAFLAKPLLRRIGLRFIPYVGWGLLALDAIDITNSLLSMATTPRIPKRAILRCDRVVCMGKKMSVEKFQKFTQKAGLRGKIGFALQASQAAETLTGYGLSLGAIMGFMTDSIWGLVRALGGERVIVRGPAPADPVSKAARVLSQAHSNTVTRDVLSLEDHALLIAAQNVATGILLESGVTVNEARIEQLAETRTALYEPWEQSSIEVLAENGITDFNDMTDVTTEDDTRVTYGSAIEQSIEQQFDWESDVRAQISSDEHWQVMHKIYTEAGRDTVNWLMDTVDEDWCDYPEDVKAIAQLAECNIALTKQYPAPMLQELIRRVVLYKHGENILGEKWNYNYTTCECWHFASYGLDVHIYPKEGTRWGDPNLRTPWTWVDYPPGTYDPITGKRIP